jgi:hypothetical protein
MPPPFNFQRGDVVRVDFFPNEEDATKGTKRWMIISDVHENHYSVFPFTKQLHQKDRYHSCLEIAKSSSLGQAMGLDADSLLIFDRKAEVEIFIGTPQLKGNCGEEFIENWL